MTDRARPAVGVVGLGNMGTPIAARIAAAGHPVVGHDAAGTSDRAPAGVAVASSAADVGARAEIVLLSLPDGPACEAVCREIAADRGTVRIVVDLSTIGPGHAVACADTLAAAGLAYVDAPVSGGVPGARDGTLAVMVGAPADLAEQVRPVLETFGKAVVRVGDAPGAGQSMKLINNFLSNTAFVATSEAVLFGLDQGLDLEVMLEVLNASTGRNSATAFKFPRTVVPGTFDLGFPASGARKDIDLYVSSVTGRGTPLGIGRALQRTWAEFAAAAPDDDTTAYFGWLRDAAGPTTPREDTP